MNHFNQLVAFSLDDGKYAVPLSVVVRIIPSIAITVLPEAPPIVLGVINVRNQIIPVINIRNRFRLAERSIRLTDHFIIARTNKRVVALVVDTVHDVIQTETHTIVAGEKILPSLLYVKGIVQMENDLVIIHDLERFLSLEEEHILDYALDKHHIMA